MIKPIVLLILFCVALQLNIGPQCSCTQLILQSECLAKQCTWIEGVCKEKLNQNTQIDETKKSICQSYTESECASQRGCAYLDGCVEFTACTSYLNGELSVCQSISTLCISDGEKCVEKSTCSDYKTSISCSQDTVGNYCFWNGSQCRQAVDCTELPKYLITDQACRAINTDCTAAPDGGCQMSGWNCANQESEVSCVWDRFMKIRCDWSGVACKNRSCESAPITIRSNEDCENYLSGCIVSKDGGCTIASNCSNIQVVDACIKDKNNNLCFWHDGKCADRVCENAKLLSNFQECQEFLNTCVPNKKGGCKTYTKCQDFDDQTTCISGLLQCLWDKEINSCTTYECTSASKMYNTHEKCTEFKNDCTVNQKQDGCQIRNCNNAPKTIITNYDCNQYLNGCITKYGGGCILNVDCIDITFKDACLYDNQNRECFWYNNTCKLKICQNAPNVYNTHEQCQTYSKNCTVKRTLNGCIDKTCDVIFDKQNCLTDYLDQKCHWNGLCFDKTCNNAPTTSDFSNDTQCRNYLNKCTVRNNLRGCMDRPYQCNEMTIQEQCILNAYDNECAWHNNKCQIKECYTAPSTLNTYELCNTYLDGCTTNGNGCQLLQSCNLYTNTESCRYDQNNNDCEWLNNLCANKSCTTADNTHTTNELCNIYLNGCIVNATGNGCIIKPTLCSQMTSNLQCTVTSTNASGTPCAWIGSCVDRTCNNAPLTSSYDTFTECNTFLNTCTVIATGTGGCMTMLNSCNLYTSQRQCEQLLNGNKCSWYLTSCLDRQCIYAPDTNNYDDKNECHNYDNRCNVVRRIQQLGCTIRKTTCNELSQYQCIKDSNNTICTWNTTASPPYCLNRSCTLTIGIVSFTPTTCSNWLSTCVVNNVATPTGCISLQSSCTNYLYQNNCTKTSSNVICYWNGSSCQTRNCSVTQSITDFDHTSCYNWLNTCTVNKPTTCYDKPTNCSDAINYDQCYKNSSDQLCAWVDTSCTDRTCNNHGYAVTIFNDTNCNNWMPGCSGNPTQTACEITRTCTNHSITLFNHTNCQNWLSSCTINSTNDACIEKTCKNYGANITDFTDTTCNEWLSKCKSNDDHTACISNRNCTTTTLTVFSYNTCNDWWDECTVSSSSCTLKTCYNHSITEFNHTNCNNWYYKCTVAPNSLGCQPKICTNAVLATYTSNTCYQWLNYCTVNNDGNGCMTKRKCSLTTLSTYNYTNCVTWSNECTHVSGSQCSDKTCINHSSNVSTLSHINCEAWLYKCTFISGSYCQDKTCYNHNDIVQTFNLTQCQSWFQSCTANSLGTNCEPKTCYNSNITVFNATNCQNWLSYCQVNDTGTGCYNTRNCSPTLSTYSHQICENYNYQCSWDGSTCRYKLCTDTNLAYYTHNYCNSYLSDCTVSSSQSGCEYKTCFNHSTQITTLTHSSCQTWLINCTYIGTTNTCIAKSCTNHGSNVTVFTHTNCKNWWDACIANDTGTACINTRTCTNAILNQYTHGLCENWLSSCTNNSTTSCQVKTCSNASSKLSSYDPITCEMYLNTCTSNMSQNACIDKTCYNHGDQVTSYSNATCSAWLSYCITNTSNSGCIEYKTCSNAVVTQYTHSNCSTWLSTCTVNSTFDGCTNKTCLNYGSNITSFTHANCQTWLSTCTNNSSTACQDKTCDNINTGSYTSVSCNSWLSYCTGNDAQTACVSTKTCTNNNLTSFTHSSCNGWLSTCTVNLAGTACETKSCSNAQLLAYGPYSDTTCYQWLNTCTVNSTFDGCLNRTCSNMPSYYTVNTTNCEAWSILCTYSGGSCVSRTCTNHGAMTLSVANCQNWLSTCSYYSGGDCEVIRTCSNYSGGISHGNCQNWLSTCTQRVNGTACTTKLCEMYTQIIGTPYSQTDCENFSSNCTWSSYTCIEKTCNNFSGTVSQTNCENWSSRCTRNTSNNACTYKTNSNAITLTYTESNCKKWSEAWSLNSSLNGCITNCYNNGLHFTVYNHSSCNNWDQDCTVNSNNTGCAVKTCSNFTGSVSYSNCNSWLSTCTNNNANSACIEKTCNNHLTNVPLWFDDSRCAAYKPDCNEASGTSRSCEPNHCTDFTDTTLSGCQSRQSYCLLGQMSCITHRTCSNHNLSVFTHKNCEDWLSTCTVNDTNNGCTEKICTNASVQAALQNGYYSQVDSYQCIAWNRVCINNGTTACKEKRCTDQSSSCESYLNACQTVSYFGYCDGKTCNSSSSYGSVTNCSNWLPYCRQSQSKRTCHTQRTCSDYGNNIKIFNKFNCEQWNHFCTVNATNNGCMYKTCFNHGMTSTSDTLCGQWLSICKSNQSNNGCEIKTCSNYGNKITSSFWAYCPNWINRQCINNSESKCVATRTCIQGNNGYNIKYDKYYCWDWLSTCTPTTSSTGCIEKTCTNHGSEVTTFNHQNCYNWYDICTNDGSTACKSKTCQNHGANVSTLNHSNCYLWLPDCTFQTGESTCNYKTCTNYQSMSVNSNTCYYWNNQCTYISGEYDCEYRTCSNYSGTINETNCRSWLSYCTPNYAATQCVSTRNCQSAQLSLYNLQTCSNWMGYCTVNGTNNGCMDKTCDNYGSQLTSFTRITCSGWLPYCTNYSTTKCEIKHCTNYPSGMGISNGNCQQWLNYCKITPIGNTCEYKTCSNHSLSTFNHGNCSNWLYYCTVSDDGKSCVTTRTCTNGNITVFTHGNCQYWLSTCTVNSGGTACETKTCTNHGSFVTTFNHNNCQNWNFACTKNTASTACELKTCANASGFSFTHVNCQNWLSTCTNNSGSTACINKTCSNTTGISTWTHNNCEIWLSQCQLNKPTTCTSLQSNCANAGVSYNQCQVDTATYNCAWYNGTCQRRTCGNYTGTTFTHADCETWLNTCTVDAGVSPTNCINKPTNCYDVGVTVDQCVTNLALINCVWLSGQCKDRTCSNYTGATFTHTDCQNWLPSCTVDALTVHAGCSIKPSACTMILTQDQCVVDINNTVCFWTGTACKVRICEDASQTTTYDDDTECMNFLKTCTVARLGECTTKATNCSDYLQESHCFKNSSQGVCFWNTDTLKCADIKCSNAPQSYTTHTQCNTFFATCTAKTGGGCMNLNGCLNYSAEVSCVIGANGDTCAWSGGRCYVKSCYTASFDSTRDTHEECQAYLSNCTVISSGIGGCVPLADCTSYTTERQCKINHLHLLCGWTGQKCLDKSCLTAPKQYIEHSECESYLNECTTVAIGNGCQMKFTDCSEYKSSKQCVVTLNAQICYWNPNTLVCEVRTCQNPPDTALTASLCEQHFQTCYTDYIYCRLQVCTDLPLKTDDECKQQDSNCTSNGITCVDRKLCTDANQYGCFYDTDKKPCQWMNNRCVYKTCNTSPNYNTTEEDCQTYYPEGNCTTKKGGGCIPKSTCENVQIKSACTTSAINQLCIWESDRCRTQVCDDIMGTSQEECNLKGCMYNGIQCTFNKTCSQLDSESTCIKGMDGVCKFIQGVCYLYVGCNTIASTSYQTCKQLSNCTTDGRKCVGLSLCSEYTISEACQEGLDGQCVWWSAQGLCKRFLSCYDLPYLNHNACYAASNKCTTDSVNGCVPLLLCDLYDTEEQCKISSNLTVCTWTSTNCRNQMCEDLDLSNCGSECTSNTEKCLTPASCDNYSDELTCLSAESTDGACTFENGSCHKIECNDIQFGYTHEACSIMDNCISDGQQCISLDICANYLTKLSCDYGGLDGTCAFNDNSCALVTSCADINLDQEVCTQNKSCKFINICLESECADLLDCENIYNIDGSIKICMVSDGLCNEVTPEQLSYEYCLAKTLNTYHWSEEKCQSCEVIAQNITTPTSLAFLLSGLIYILF